MLGPLSLSENLGSPNDLTSGACSTAIIGGDKSNYWTP